MIDLRIGLNDYHLPLTWQDVTLQDAIQLHSVCSKHIPKDLKDKYSILLTSANEEECTDRLKEWVDSLDDNYVNVFIPFIDKVFNHFNVDVSKATDESKIDIYTRYLELFVVGVLNNGAGYNTIGFDEFAHNGTFYELPREKNIAGDIIPMYNLLTIQFTECADILALTNTQGLKLLPFFISTLVLPHYYDEDFVIDKAKDFNDLPMDLVWECVQQFQTFHSYCHSRFTNLFKPSKSSSKVKMSNSWRNLIIDAHLSSNKLLAVDDIENSRILDTMEIADRESEVTEYQNKLQEEQSKKAKK